MDVPHLCIYTERVLTNTNFTTEISAVTDAPTAEQFSKIGVLTLGDLISYWPRTHRERGSGEDISLISDGAKAVVEGVVVKLEERKIKNSWRKYIVANVSTPHMQIVQVTFFAPAEARAKGLTLNAPITVSGKVGSRGRVRTLTADEWEIGASAEVGEAGIAAGSIASIYPATASTSSPWIAANVHSILDQIPALPDFLPAEIRTEFRLPPYDWAVRSMHKPASLENAVHARRRLAFDEAFGVQLALARRRYGANAPKRVPLTVSGDLLAQFDKNLPFNLTEGQVASGRQIDAAMIGEEIPMNCLLIGEVGSGKTMVATRALLRAIDCGSQGALVAPTEVLAKQHFESLSADLEVLGVKVAYLTGSLKPGERRAVLKSIKEGSVDLVIGTHSILSKEVEFLNLGLAVIDEQHRFGVEARDALRAQTPSPHMIVMTATPIPRSLAMTVYGDLDVLRIEGLPSGRKPIQTFTVPESRDAWMDRFWSVLTREIANGRQAFIVAPLIDSVGNSDKQGKSVADIAQAAQERLDSSRVAILHGKLSDAEKDSVMADFAAGAFDVLVATTVIEVGVNVPNATVMAVWGADNFGVAQLHQLRGRVGRGEHQGTCFLISDQPEDHPSWERLSAVANSLDGFALAELDLKARREGDVTSTGQAGASKFKLIELASAEKMLSAARSKARAIIKEDPTLERTPILARWLDAQLTQEQQDNLTKA